DRPHAHDRYLPAHALAPFLAFLETEPSAPAEVITTTEAMPAAQASVTTRLACPPNPPRARSRALGSEIANRCGMRPRRRRRRQGLRSGFARHPRPAATMASCRG